MLKNMLRSRGLSHLLSLGRSHHTAATSIIRAASSPISTNQDHRVANDIASHLAELRLSNSAINSHINASSKPQYQEYKLPTVINGFVPKKTILDPVFTPKVYELPTQTGVVQEKLTPSLTNVKIEDPNPLQRIIDQGAPPLTKECMPYLVQIRKRKMKKHKLKKLRKRMIFLNRKLTAIKKAKKEAKLREFENLWAERGRNFDADAWVDDRLEKSRKGGWRIDIWKEYREKKASQTEVNQ